MKMSSIGGLVSQQYNAQCKLIKMFFTKLLNMLKHHHGFAFIQHTPGTPRTARGTQPNMFRLVSHYGFKQLFPPGRSCQITLSQAKTHCTSVKLICLAGQFTVRTAENFNQVNLFALFGIAMLGNQKFNLKPLDKFL